MIVLVYGRAVMAADLEIVLIGKYWGPYGTCCNLTSNVLFDTQGPGAPKAQGLTMGSK